ncbi:hypothetical protein N7535_009098 [Penicillium sp. DV-2018c]|nr:hypothetical protein N7461_003006 [Penicillium sp. DV-2018c]KAJ5560901.1 hypothetical protein N7535_009098 [Penicillium sp. DV-2018c]
MFSLKSWLLFLAFAVSCVTSNQEPSDGSSSNSPQECCEAIRNQLPSIVHFPQTPEYKARHSAYYSLQQQELFPACTVKPMSPEDVSRVLQIAKAGQCRFAVASGGHMAWKGSSNLDNGFVFDMRGLDKIEFSSSKKSVKLGPGSPWVNVYAEMSRYNVTVAGARINAVGVGGFLTGGGFTFRSQTLGLGSNNVFNYEVVLSNGTVVNANDRSHPDLFWALKLAGSNYGIVTRFDMNTYHSPAIWGAISLYPVTNQTVSEVLADYEVYSHDNNNTNVFKSFVLVKTAAQDMLMTVMANTDGVPESPATSVPPLQHVEEISSTHDVVNDVIAGALDSTARAAWFTFTTTANTRVALDTYELAGNVFKPLMKKDGLSVVVSSQAFQKSFIEATRGSPIYNSLKKPGKDLTMMLILVTWSDPADDRAMEAATDRLGTLAEKEARKNGMLADFIYMNYANGEQKVYERSVTPEDLTRMLQVRDAYDPGRTMEKLWHGGYKLPHEDVHGTGTKDEL